VVGAVEGASRCEEVDEDDEDIACPDGWVRSRNGKVGSRNSNGEVDTPDRFEPLPEAVVVGVGLGDIGRGGYTGVGVESGKEDRRPSGIGNGIVEVFRSVIVDLCCSRIGIRFMGIC
jgi:hypothetical protein